MLVNYSSVNQGMQLEELEENEIFKQLSPIETLTEDVAGAIIVLCHLPERNAMLRVSKRWNKITDHPDQWQNMAKILNISFYKEINENRNYYWNINNGKSNKNSLKVKVYSNLNSFKEKLYKKEDSNKEDIKNCIQLIGKQSLISVENDKGKPLVFDLRINLNFNADMQNEIKKLLKSVSQESIETVQKLGHAIDTLMFWVAIKSIILNFHCTFAFEQCDSAEELIERAGEFKEWCEINAASLSEITILNFDAPPELNGKGLNSLPGEIWQFLPNLEGIRITGKGITFLPEEIGEFCPKLVVINLQSNWLMSLPESFSNLKNLETLIIAGNWLKELPTCVLELKNLKKLDISANRISSLPENFSKLENLENVDISWNLIDSLESVTKLKKLKELYANHNDISIIPNDISELTELIKVEIIDNSIQSLPNEILKLKNLRHLNLKYNALWIKVPKDFWTSDLANRTEGLRKHVQVYNDFVNNPILNMVAMATICVAIMIFSIF